MSSAFATDSVCRAWQLLAKDKRKLVLLALACLLVVAVGLISAKVHHSSLEKHEDLAEDAAGSRLLEPWDLDVGEDCRIKSVDASCLYPKSAYSLFDLREVGMRESDHYPSAFAKCRSVCAKYNDRAEDNDDETSSKLKECIFNFKNGHCTIHSTNKCSIGNSSSSGLVAFSPGCFGAPICGLAGIRCFGRAVGVEGGVRTFADCAVKCEEHNSRVLLIQQLQELLLGQKNGTESVTTTNKKRRKRKRGCEWISYDGETGECRLLSSCPRISRGVDGWVSGEGTCGSGDMG